jgi:hypothetical protein
MKDVFEYPKQMARMYQRCNAAGHIRKMASTRKGPGEPLCLLSDAVSIIAAMRATIEETQTEINFLRSEVPRLRGNLERVTLILKEKEKEVSKMNAWGQNGLMAVCAVEYCLGRKTYITNTCADWLDEVWKVLPERAQHLIRRSVEEAFEKDDEAMFTGGRRTLGADIDRSEWERVRKLWSSNEQTGNTINTNNEPTV